ncbi:DegT/DnrJ/EryC1/StrS family aminotransferase [Candidatus Amarolinea dominans]|uniref:DegT/DnrJ/EryC1/StrS family aminotransferase n=1 Tax=Candidatus Amarolinea dominans TaxID=3140696 RepID=UPI003136099F|nr:DegT/DnrJ/EryC1/StrS family aminotransferase [Anaerolineae bacterium]
MGGIVITNPVLPWARGRFLPPSATPHTAADLAASLAAAARTGAEAAFARDLTALTGCPSVHLTASGRAAFFLILEAGKRLRPDRREVVLPAYTCPVLAYAAHAAGLRVRLVDMEPQTLDYDRAAGARHRAADIGRGQRTSARSAAAVGRCARPRPRRRRLPRGRRRAGLRRTRP